MPASEFQATQQTSWMSRNKLAITPWVFLIPALIFFAIYVVIPIFQSITLSFYEWNGLYDADGNSTATWVGLENYKKLWTDPKFWVSLKNNVLWLFLFMLAVPLGLFIALFLNQTVPGMRFYKSMFFFPFVISQVVVGLIFGWFYNPDFGVVGSLWKLAFCEETTNILGNVTFKCSRTPPDILSSSEYATYGIIAAGLWPQIAYCMILYLTGLNNVAADQIEAGRLDGAKGWKMLWYVVLPQLRPATFIAVVVTVIGALRSFDMIAIMTQGGPYGSTNVLSYYMFETAISEYGERYGYGSSIATVLFIIMLFFISYFLWRMYQDEKGGR
ncbi:sugar ABC transporter permease [Amylibacter sp. IMCC11727]|uniref:carbohydrate ABC transporter permease n=1 Tax=Amylibacter sp. IMCC11727 TaxID=3039851 RepID=UPI00244E1049|nr:sugar ABC transporter permease [Amylibacter sp. IMCC11727]WGI22772.1 sugar ABC transporter permease [Amylibacter sp. IMCC11727]